MLAFSLWGRQMRKFTNAKVGLEFNKVLSAHPLFASNYKLISPCHYLLDKINGDCTFRKTEYVPLYSQLIQDLFQAYTTAYRPVIDALLALDLIEIRPNENGAESYLHSQDKSKSFSKSYKVTAKCAKLLAAENTEWLRKLHNDPQTRRKVSRCKTQRLRRLKLTGDLVVDSTLDNLSKLKYDRGDAAKILAATGDANRANNIIYSLINIETGDFSVKRHKETGRIYNTWNSMNSQLRPIFYIRCKDKELFNSHVIDLRAAHPCFLAIYVKNYYNTSNIYNKLPISTSIHNYSHYVTLDEAFSGEVDRWNALWTNPTIDPRDVIAAELKTSKERVKSLLNTAINDSRNTNSLHLWIKNKFPLLHAAWQKLVISQTGVNISRLYESRLIRDNEFHAFINNIEGIKVMDEHDGLSVFSSLDDTEIELKVASIIEYIALSCFNKFGIKPVIKACRVQHAMT